MKGIPLAVALFLTGTMTSAAAPARIYRANDDHTDYLWTATSVRP